MSTYIGLECVHLFVGLFVRLNTDFPHAFRVYEEFVKMLEGKFLVWLILDLINDGGASMPEFNSCKSFNFSLSLPLSASLCASLSLIHSLSFLCSPLPKNLIIFLHVKDFQHCLQFLSLYGFNFISQERMR